MVTLHINLRIFLNHNPSSFIAFAQVSLKSDRNVVAKSCKSSVYYGFLPGPTRRRRRICLDEGFIGVGFRGEAGEVFREIPRAWWTCFQLPCGSRGGGSPKSEVIERYRNKNRMATAAAEDVPDTGSDQAATICTSVPHNASFHQVFT